MADKIKITFLGTGSMSPDEKRGHPAFLISHKGENILVDCGEGTQIQFRKAKLDPCKITRILITHWHGDHTFGLPGLLRTLSRSGYRKKLSGKFFGNNDFYLEAERMIHVQPCNAYNFVVKGNVRIDKRKLRKFKIKEGKHLADLKKKGYMIHNGKKYLAKQLTYAEGGRKVSFVLDTLNNERIAPFVKDSDLLVSEASFSSDLERLAHEYKHLTSKQAAEIAKKGKVKKLMLTHLSQRYSKNPDKLLNEAKKVFRNTALAQDLETTEI